MHASSIGNEYSSKGCKLWHDLLHEYKGRSLTDEQDILIAISGVAKALQDEVRDHTREDKFGYLAGLWGQYLPTELLWQVYRHISEVTPAVRSEKYRAPSWSWASINGWSASLTGITNSEHPFMIRIDDAFIDTVGPNQFGQVRGGYLKLTGWLSRFQCSEEEVARGHITKDGYIIAYLAPDVLTEFEPNTDFYFLPIVEFRNQGHYASFDRELHGLILQETRHGECEFRRLGRFVSYAGIIVFRRPTYTVNHHIATNVSNTLPDQRIVSFDDESHSKINYESISDEMKEIKERIKYHEHKTLSDLAKSMEWKEETILLV